MKLEPSIKVKYFNLFLPSFDCQIQEYEEQPIIEPGKNMQNREWPDFMLVV